MSQLCAHREAICLANQQPEKIIIEQLIPHATLSIQQSESIHQYAKTIVTNVRESSNPTLIEAFFNEFSLASEEGLALLSLAEALLRIPDKTTINALLEDKMTITSWMEHTVTKTDGWMMQAALMGLQRASQLLSPSDPNAFAGKRIIKTWLKKTAMPIVRLTVMRAMHVLNKQFILGNTIEDALKQSKQPCYSYDMLGEEAMTAEDANCYFQAYKQAMITIARTVESTKNVQTNAGISIKLSALHPRFEFAKQDRVLKELVPKLSELLKIAKANRLSLTIDAEESVRLELMLNVFEALVLQHSLDDWSGLGMAVQAYQKRAFWVIDWLAALAQRHQCRFHVRLVKGAYWDTEIKAAQMHGLETYPVFTQKPATDLSYVACLKRLIEHSESLYACFATHNAYSIATVIASVPDHIPYEFQCLYGMGAAVYDQVQSDHSVSCRVYAPVGDYRTLLPYLVRRLMENGANTSFIHQVSNPMIPIKELIEDPIVQLKRVNKTNTPPLPLPESIFGEERLNSLGIDLTDTFSLNTLQQKINEALEKPWRAAPIIKGIEHFEQGEAVRSPADNNCVVGYVQMAHEKQVQQALQIAHLAKDDWNQRCVKARAHCLEHAAEYLMKHRYELMALLIAEAGKTIVDAHSEVREAIDFCRYYAAQSIKTLSIKTLKGYTGEDNFLHYHGRGVMVCISPWNFPLAIFVGQIAASLVAGNTVIAKPAQQTSLIAALTVRLFHAAGIPGSVLQLLPGHGSIVGTRLVQDPRCQGVLFTGSTQTATIINRQLAKRSGPIVPFIAETGGQNVMIADSSAHTEQLVQDIMVSAFSSAGQRCSALRVLYLPEQTADRVLTMLKGAMEELRIGLPEDLATDIGPVIDAQAKQHLIKHTHTMAEQGKAVDQLLLPEDTQKGSYQAPTLIEIASIRELPQEVFGPILHVIRYRQKDIGLLLEEINQTGFGLTCGIQSRIQSTLDNWQQQLQVGNCYINRDMIGAVVGVQPFGGRGLSGTGPKAGGPHYLHRLCTEQTVTVNTTALGGNAELLS